MRDKRVIIVITFALMLAIFASVYVAYQRIRVEKENSVEELTADYGDIERIAFLDKIPVRAVLNKFAMAGIVSVALTEDLANSTDINLISGIDPKKLDLYIPSLGLSPEKVKMVKEAGLKVIPRIRNSFSIDRKLISEKIKALSGFDTVIFAEEEVLGYPNYLRETAAALRSSGIRYGFIEFGKQMGDTALSSLLASNIIKVHSIPQEEMDNLSRVEMMQRYMRAARERNIRILYVHTLPYADNGKDLVQTNTSFIESLKAELLSDGFTIGNASIPSAVRGNRVITSLISLGIGAAFALLLNYFAPINFLITMISLLIFVLLPVKLLALATAVIFPSYAVISQFPSRREPFPYGVISRSVSITVHIAAITAAGAIFIASLLADKAYMLGIDAFSGIKIALVLPILIVAAYFFFKVDGEDRFDVKASFPKIKELANTDLKIYHAVLFLAAAAAAALFILRSGNFGIPVSGTEKIGRDLLEKLLYVRPRTKEFLLGYPAIVLAAVYYLKGGNKWLWLLLAIGVLAPVSMTNTFCHIHTPLLISVVRSCVGLVLGIAIGLLLYFAYSIFNPFWSKNGV